MTQDRPQVGTLSEEALKLVAALQEWTRESAADAGGARSASDLLKDLNQHVATGAEECRYCPICRFVAAVRATSPEVKHHLGVAASSLLKAAAGVMEAQSDQASSSAGPVEHIDLDGTDWEDDDR